MLRAINTRAEKAQQLKKEMAHKEVLEEERGSRVGRQMGEVKLQWDEKREKMNGQQDVLRTEGGEGGVNLA